MGENDDENEGSWSDLVPEFARILENSNKPPDLSQMLAWLRDVLGKLGVPDDLISLDVLEFRRELTVESDRGVALFAAAHLDDRLGELLRAFLVDDQKVMAPLLQGNGALTTFSSRIDLAYLLGLLPASVHRDLHLIRKVRNDFAHSSKALRFEEQAIASRCRELTHVAVAKKPRDRFVQAAMGCAGTIDGGKRLIAQGQIPRCEPAKERSGDRLGTAKKLLGMLANSVRPPSGDSDGAPASSDEPPTSDPSAEPR